MEDIRRGGRRAVADVRRVVRTGGERYGSAMCYAQMGRDATD